MYRSDYESFITNPIWLEMKKNIEEAMLGLQEELIKFNAITETVELSRAQGRIMMADDVLRFPADILLEIKDKEKELEEKKDG